MEFLQFSLVFSYRENQDIIAVLARRGNSAILRQKLLEGHLHDVRDNHGWFPIHHASFCGHNSCVKILLEHDPANNLKDEFNDSSDTPISLAALSGHDEIMKTLLEHGANIKKGNGVLVAAITGGHKDCIKICLDNKVDVNALDVHGSAALHTAAGIGDVGITKILLEAHANIDIEGQKCYGKRTPLFEAVMHRRLACMKTLLDHKANVNMGNRSKETPLFIASQHGDLESVQALLDAGADVTSQTTSHATALHTAARGGHLEIVKVLIKSGADVNAKSEQGVTSSCECGSACCLDERYRRPGGFVRKRLRRPRKSKSDYASDLLKNRADANRLTYSYPIIEAARNCYVHCISVLLDHGTDVNVVDQAGNTPLMICLMKCLWASLNEKNHDHQLNCLTKLLKAGAKITQLLSGSKSPFQFVMDIEKTVSTDLILLLLTFVPHEPSIKEYMNRYLPSYMATENRKKINKIMTLLENPCSLLHLSRLKVRELLKSNRLHKIKELPLPKGLQGYLEFQDLSECTL